MLPAIQKEKDDGLHLHDPNHEISKPPEDDHQDNSDSHKEIGTSGNIKSETRVAKMWIIRRTQITLGEI